MIKQNFLSYMPNTFRIVLLLGAVALLVPQQLSAANCQKLRFYPQKQFFSGGSPLSIATGDLNGDSKVDFAIPDPGNNFFSIFYNDGAGNFTGPTKVTTGSYPHDLTIGDFNGDGLGDLAVLGAFSVGVEVFLNNGNGTFTPPVDYPVAGDPAKIIMADFDLDGELDLAVNYSAGTNLDVYLGTGTGTFSAPVNSTAAATGRMAVGDFDEDGVPDLAVSDYGAMSLSILHGDGTGHFTLSSTYGLGGNAGAVVTGDFNRDSHQDVAVSVYNISPNNHIAVYFGSGNGSLIAGQEILVSPTGMVAADFNADGKLDLAGATFTSQQVVFMVGQRTGNLRPPQGATIRGRNPQPIALATADFNEDGRADIVTADHGQGTATVLLSIPCQP